MRSGLNKSLALHAVVILIAIFGLPHLTKDDVMTAMPIAVEVVSPDQVASAPQKANHPKPAPAKPTPEPPKPPTPPALPQPVAPTPPPVPDKTAVPPPPSEQPKEKPPEKPPENQEEVKPPPVPKVRPQPPKTPQKPAPAKTDTKPQKPEKNAQFDSLLDVLANNDETKPVRDGVEDSPVDESPNISSLLNGGEMDAVRQQVMGCWLEPTGLKEGENYMVEIKVEVNPDRTIRSARVVDSPKMHTDPFYRTLGESAVRALYNPRCSPLKLPESKYNSWRTITFRFSPGGMM